MAHLSAEIVRLRGVPINRAAGDKRQEPPTPSYRVTPTQLLELAPRLGRYMPPNSRDSSFEAIIEAAFWLSGEMRISNSLWARACQVMGRETAAVALAIVSTRPDGHFTS